MRLILQRLGSVAGAFVLGFACASLLLKPEGASKAPGAADAAATPEASGQCRGPGSLGQQALDVEKLDSALTAAFQQLNGSRRRHALLAFGDTIPLSHIPQVMARVWQRSEAEIPCFTKLLLCRWAQADPAAALSWIQSLPAHGPRAEYVQIVLTEWAADAPVGALEWAKRLPEGRDQDQGLRVILSAVAERSPREALTLIDSLGFFPAKAEVLASILQRWAQTDPSAAARAVTGREKGLAPEVVADLARRWAAKDTKTALAWAETLGHRIRSRAIEAVVSVWSEKDLSGAAAFAWSQAAGKSRDSMIDSVVGRWASVDAAAALAWANQLPEGQNRDRALQQVLERSARADPKAAATYALSISATDRRDGTVSQVASEWYKADPDAAQTWMNSLPTATFGAAARGIFSQALSQDPKQAADFVASLSDAVTRNSLLGELAGGLARTDIVSAVDWLEQMPKGQPQVKALMGMVDLWARADPQAAAEFAALSVAK